MKISKLKIKNLFGINEFEADSKSIEFSLSQHAQQMTGKTLSPEHFKQIEKELFGIDF